MFKILEKTCIIVATMLVFSVLATSCVKEEPSQGISSSSPNSNITEGVDETKDFVELKMYLLGEEPVAGQEIYEEISNKLKEDINASLVPIWLGWADWTQKYSLLFASGEDFDIVYTSFWAMYQQEAAKGAFYELKEDVLKKYAPKTFESTPDIAWKQAAVDGKLYMLPAVYEDFFNRCIIIRGDLREKYGLAEISSLDDYINYLDAVSENETGMFPLDISSQQAYFVQELFFNQPNEYIMDQYIGYKIGSTKIDNIIENPNYKEFLQMTKEFKEKGYWSENALNSVTNIRDSFMNGKSASAIWGLDPLSSAYSEVMAINPEWKPEIIDGTFGKAVESAGYTGNGIAIHGASKNPERSLMALDLLKNNEDYYNLVWFGIEGKHYNLSDKESYIVMTQEGQENYPYDGAGQWAFKNTELHKFQDGGAPNFLDIRNDWIDRSVISSISGYSKNSDNINTEIATVTNVYETYNVPMILGFMDDVDNSYDELKNRYENAGIDKILSEWQAQADEFAK